MMKISTTCRIGNKNAIIFSRYSTIESKMKKFHTHIFISDSKLKKLFYNPILAILAKTNTRHQSYEFNLCKSQDVVLSNYSFEKLLIKTSRLFFHFMQLYFFQILCKYLRNRLHDNIYT